MKRILIINGPNLNLLGRREPHIYGTSTLADIQARTQSRAPAGCELDWYQSNHEGDIIDRIQAAAAEGFDGIVLNAGGYTHTSVAIADAIAAAGIPVAEVHLTNIMAREPMRRVSVIAPACAGSISGFGPSVYALAVAALCATGNEI